MGLVTGKQTAEDADAATNEQKTSGEKQQRIAGDGVGNSLHLRENGGTDSTEISDQFSHSSCRSLQSHILS